MGLTALRVELKYRVPAELLEGFSRRLPPHETRSYGVTTTYLDRRDGSLSRTAVETPFQCMKIRLREYWLDGSALWVEIKVRSWAWTRKMRFRIGKTAVPALLAGEPVYPLPLEDASPAALHDLNKAYRHLRDHPDPRFVLLGCVTARRTTYAFADEPVRFSLDQDISYYAPPPALYASGAGALPEQLGRPIERLPHAILELKDGGRSPQWCQNAAAGMELLNYSKFRSLLQSLKAAGGAPRVD